MSMHVATTRSSHLALWWSLESRLDVAASLCALGLGVLAALTLLWI